jgi:hypothetical protein
MTKKGPAKGLTRAAAGELAARLDLNVHDTPICLACLSFVAVPIGSGDEAEAARSARRMAPDLWAEGLEQPVRLALRRARDAGVPDADAAILDVEARGPRSATVRAIVLRLGRDLDEHARGDFLKMGFQPWPPAELSSQIQRIE